MARQLRLRRRVRRSDAESSIRVVAPLLRADASDFLQSQIDSLRSELDQLRQRVGELQETISVPQDPHDKQ